MNLYDTGITQVVTPSGTDYWINGIYQDGQFFDFSYDLDDPLQGYVIARMVDSSSIPLNTIKYPSSSSDRAKAMGWKNLHADNGHFLGAKQGCFWETIAYKPPGESGHINEQIPVKTKPGLSTAGYAICITKIHEGAAHMGSTCPVFEAGPKMNGNRLYRASSPNGCNGDYNNALSPVIICFYATDPSVKANVTVGYEPGFDGLKIKDLPEEQSFGDNDVLLIHDYEPGAKIMKPSSAFDFGNSSVDFFDKPILFGEFNEAADYEYEQDLLNGIGGFKKIKNADIFNNQVKIGYAQFSQINFYTKALAEEELGGSKLQNHSIAEIGVGNIAAFILSMKLFQNTAGSPLNYFLYDSSYVGTVDNLTNNAENILSHSYFPGNLEATEREWRRVYGSYYDRLYKYIHRAMTQVFNNECASRDHQFLARFVKVEDNYGGPNNNEVIDTTQWKDRGARNLELVTEIDSNADPNDYTLQLYIHGLLLNQ